MSDTRREFDRDQAVALDDRDPSNSDVETLVAALDPDDDVFALIAAQQGALAALTPADGVNAD